MRNKEDDGRHSETWLLPNPEADAVLLVISTVASGDAFCLEKISHFVCTGGDSARHESLLPYTHTESGEIFAENFVIFRRQDVVMCGAYMRTPIQHVVYDVVVIWVFYIDSDLNLDIKT